MSQDVSLQEARQRLGVLKGRRVSEIDVAAGEIFIEFGVAKPKLRISAVNWQLTDDGLLVATSFVNHAARLVQRKLGGSLVGTEVESSEVRDSLALAIHFSAALAFITLPLLDRGRQARLGDVQWSLEGEDGLDLEVTGWGKVVSISHASALAEPDFAEGLSHRHRETLAQVVDVLRERYQAKVIADGRLFNGPDVVMADDEGRRFVVEVKRGDARPSHIAQLLRWTSDAHSPAFGARPILVVERMTPKVLDELGDLTGVLVLTVDELMRGT